MISKWPRGLSAFLAFSFLFAGDPVPVNVWVDPAKGLKITTRANLGVNVNHLMDGGVLPFARSYAEQVTELGVRFLRYPDGAQADHYLWGRPPFSKASGHLFFPERWTNAAVKRELWFDEKGRGTSNVLDFDRFMEVAKAAHAEPILVVPTAYRAGNGKTRASHAAFLSNAEAWVRYANVVKKHGVKYFEIGTDPAAPASRIGMSNVRRDIETFSAVMKAVDPRIKVIASAESAAQFTQLLQSADFIDGITLKMDSLAEAGGSFDRYREMDRQSVGLPLGRMRRALAELDPVAANKIRIHVSDWVGLEGLSGDRRVTLGRAVALFQVAGELSAAPDVDWAIFRQDRAFGGEPAGIDEALKPNGELALPGRILSLWSRLLQFEFVTCGAKDDRILVWAVMKSDHRKGRLFLVNKRSAPMRLSLGAPDSGPLLMGKLRLIEGKDENDPDPRYSEKTFESPVTALTLPGPCAAVVDFELSN